MTLGTKVIRFREQNDKLYVFDVDTRRKESDIFNPDLIVDAFPIVKSDRFHALPGSGSYVLIDPAAGLNHFNALSDFFGSDPGPVKMAVELSFVQDFRPASDGGSYEQIVTGYTDIAIGGGIIDANDYRMAGTLGVSFRRYSEGAAYHQVAAPPLSFYFLGQNSFVPNTGEITAVAAHWGFSPGMTPIKWVIGREIQQFDGDPALGSPHLFQAIKAGIESWNAVFGFPVFTAELAGANDSFAEDHTNFFIIDPDPSKGFAFADWRTNPNTGETRGASVYFSSGFFFPFPDDPMAAQNALPKTKVPGLAWLGERREPLCVLWAPRWEPEQFPGHDDSALTGGQKLERYVQETAAHEVGHTLGLRHNFKGSLVPPTSSVMEYNTATLAIAAPTPGVYDQQAIHYLYGQSTDLPSAPFCTDEDTLVDPNCVRFDTGAVPLINSQIPRYRFLIGRLFTGIDPATLTATRLATTGTQLLAYVRAGTPEEAAAAYQVALEGSRPPLTTAQLANPVYFNAADAITAFTFSQLFVRPTGTNTLPLSDPGVMASIAADAKNILVNLDGVRFYPTRRLVVDAMKNAQHLAAYQALLDARAALADQLATLPPADQALTRDLIARIDAAISPYFR